MRLFAALTVTEPAQAELTALVASLAGEGWPVRWVRPDGLHLTVRFLGSVPPEQEAPINTVLARASLGTPPLSLVPHAVGGFPTLSRARVIWAGYQAEPALELLVHRVEVGLAPLGFEPDGRAFHPHVTLGRVPDGRKLPLDLINRLEAVALAEPFMAEGLTLYQSETAPGGAKYSPRAHFRFDS